MAGEAGRREVVYCYLLTVFVSHRQQMFNQKKYSRGGGKAGICLLLLFTYRLPSYRQKKTFTRPI